jgi:O-antigen ligase
MTPKTWQGPLLFSLYLLFFSVFSSASGIGLGTGLVTLFGLLYLKGKIREVQRLPIWGAFLLFAIAIGTSVVFSDAHGVHFAKAVLKLRYFLVAFLMACCFADRPVWRDRIAQAVVPLSILFGIIALTQFFGVFRAPAFLHLTKVELAVIPQSNGHFYHARGLLYHHNPFAFGMLLLFYLSIGQALYHAEARWRRWFWISAVFCLISILASCSRGAWVALILSGLSLGLVQGRRFWKGYAVAGVVAILIAAALGGAVKNRFRDIRPEKNQERLRLWAISWQLFLDSPLVGHGYHESFETKRVPYMNAEEKRITTFPTDPHSVYMDLLGTTGLFGFLTFLYFLFSVLRSYWRALRRADLADEHRAILLAAWAAFICFIFGAAFDSHLYHTETLSVMLYGLSLGQGVVLALRQRARQEAPAKPGLAGLPLHATLPQAT